MARVNTDDHWWVDPRRAAFSELVGDTYRADGIAQRAWRIAQEYWAQGRRLVPITIFKTLPCAEHFLSVGLAHVVGEFVYVCGTTERAEWRLERAESGRKGAQVTNAKRWNTASSKPLDNSVGTAAANVSKSQQTSASSSSSSSKDLKTIGQSCASAQGVEGFDEFWKLYPRKLKRTEALKRFKQVITPSKLPELMQALQNFKAYHQRIKTELQFIPYPTSFLGTKSHPSWADWISPPQEAAGPPLTSSPLGADELAKLNAQLKELKHA